MLILKKKGEKGTKSVRNPKLRWKYRRKIFQRETKFYYINNYYSQEANNWNETNESKIDPHFRMQWILRKTILNLSYISVRLIDRYCANKSIKIVIKLFEFYLSSIQLFTYAKLSLWQTVFTVLHYR